MKFDVLNRWTGEVAFTAEIDAGESTPYSAKLGLAVQWAVTRANLADTYLAGANLTGANLTGANLADTYLAGANLTGADLTGADLTGANLADADLADANLTGADLTRADLTGANLADAYLTGADLADANLTRANLADAYLTGADLADANLTRANLADAYLTGADLADANLTGANLTGADLTGADLTGADLADANLTGANLTGANLRAFKADIWMTLSENAAEVPGLMAAIRNGRIDGSSYTGECACLVGTIANTKGCSYTDLHHRAGDPGERWFSMIATGDKPGAETGGGFAAKLALQWCEEWCAAHGVPVEADTTK